MEMKILTSLLFLLQYAKLRKAKRYDMTDMCRYQYDLESVDWCQASKQCEMLHKTLAVVDDADEEAFIETTLLPNLRHLNFKMLDVQTTEFWIGSSIHALFHSNLNALLSPTYGSGSKPFLCEHDSIDWNTCYIRTTLNGATLKTDSMIGVSTCLPMFTAIYMRTPSVVALTETDNRCTGLVLDLAGAQRPNWRTVYLKNILIPTTNMLLSDYACAKTSQINDGDSTSHVDVGSTKSEYSTRIPDNSGKTTHPLSTIQPEINTNQGSMTQPLSTVTPTITASPGSMTQPLSTVTPTITTIPGSMTQPLSTVTPTITTIPVMEGCRTTCPCFNKSAADVNITLEELLQSMLKNREQLIVKRETLSSWKRKHYSAQDTRTSSTTIGYIGAIIIGMMIGFLVMMDLPDIVIALRPHCSRKWRRQKTSTAKETQTNGQASMDKTTVNESNENGSRQMQTSKEPDDTQTAGQVKADFISVDETSETKSVKSFKTSTRSHSKVKCRKVYPESIC